MLIYETPEWSQIIAAWAPVLYAGIMSCGVAYTHHTGADSGGTPQGSISEYGGKLEGPVQKENGVTEGSQSETSQSETSQSETSQ